MAYELMAATDEPDGKALLEYLLLMAYCRGVSLALGQAYEQWAREQALEREGGDAAAG